MAAPAEVDRETVPASAGHPLTAETFLTTLYPLPAPTLHIQYDLRGPQGRRGTMEVYARPGGYVRQDWRLDEVSGETARSGTWIRTPHAEWSGGPGLPPRLVGHATGVLARAFEEQSPDAQRKILATIGRWHELLRTRRDDVAAAPLETRLGHPCRPYDIAGARFCVWEEAGLVLSYESDSVAIEARTISRAAPLDARQFELPGDPPTSLNDEPAVDAPTTLAALASGNAATVARVLRPTVVPLVGAG